MCTPDTGQAHSPSWQLHNVWDCCCNALLIANPDCLTLLMPPMSPAPTVSFTVFLLAATFLKLCLDISDYFACCLLQPLSGYWLFSSLPLASTSARIPTTLMLVDCLGPWPLCSSAPLVGKSWGQLPYVRLQQSSMGGTRVTGPSCLQWFCVIPKLSFSLCSLGEPTSPARGVNTDSYNDPTWSLGYKILRKSDCMHQIDGTISAQQFDA